jgi:hypothetical protein
MAAQGPKTAVGKAAVRLNAVRHGIHSDSPVIAKIESDDDWQIHLLGILESYAPKGRLESELAERVALLLWRLHRVTRYERYSIELGQERIVDEIAKSLSRQARNSLRSMAEIDADPDQRARRIAADERLIRNLERFPDLDDAESLILADVVSIVDAVMEAVNGLPEEVEYEVADFSERSGWTVHDVALRLKQIALAVGSDVSSILTAATERTKLRLGALRVEAEKLSLQADRMSRDRLLPDDAVVAKVTRYESHLHRQLLQTMHELEALQERRRGGVTPLARLDVVEGREASQETSK